MTEGSRDRVWGIDPGRRRDTARLARSPGILGGETPFGSAEPDVVDTPLVVMLEVHALGNKVIGECIAFAITATRPPQKFADQNLYCAARAALRWR